MYWAKFTFQISYMTEELPIRRKTPSNQSINQSINQPSRQRYDLKQSPDADKYIYMHRSRDMSCFSLNFTIN